VWPNYAPKFPMSCHLVYVSEYSSECACVCVCELVAPSYVIKNSDRLTSTSLPTSHKQFPVLPIYTTKLGRSLCCVVFQQFCFCGNLFLSHTNTHIYIYIYIYTSKLDLKINKLHRKRTHTHTRILTLIHTKHTHVKFSATFLVKNNIMINTTAFYGIS